MTASKIIFRDNVSEGLRGHFRGCEVTPGSLSVYFRLVDKVGGSLKRAMTFVGCCENNESKFVDCLQRSKLSCTLIHLLFTTKTHKPDSLPKVTQMSEPEPRYYFLHSFCNHLMHDAFALLCDRHWKGKDRYLLHNVMEEAYRVLATQEALYRKPEPGE